MTTSERERVTALGQAIAQRIGEPRYNLWFAGRTKFAWAEDQVTVGVANHFVQDWLQARFVEEVRAAAAEVIGRVVPVRFVIDPELFQEARRQQEGCTGHPAAPAPQATTNGALGAPNSVPGTQQGTPTPNVEAPKQKHQADRSAKPSPNKRSRRWHRLRDFVVGASNRVAHASAQSVVEQPGQNANPLVLHGPVGTGKSHLLQGIYVGLRKQYPDWRVLFLGAEDFTNRFLHAMHHGKLLTFRKHFRECDALLLDDLHFLETKKATQEEFLHTFDVLHADGRQIVVTCDCHPRLTEAFKPELTDRLLGGAIWGLTPPDLETRLTILRAKVAQTEAAVPEDVLRLMANQLRGNVRELEGALNSVQHFSRVAGRPIDLALAQAALGDLLRHAVRVVQLGDVDRAVCRVLRLELGTLQSRQRAWAVSHPRMLAMFLGRKHTTAAYSEVGQYFGGRNHSTAVAAEKKVRQWLQADGELNLGQRRWHVREVVELVERELFR